MATRKMRSIQLKLQQISLDTVMYARLFIPLKCVIKIEYADRKTEAQFCHVSLTQIPLPSNMNTT